MDEKSGQRKQDHLELAKQAQTPSMSLDKRFNYEPLFFAHCETLGSSHYHFLGHELKHPFWISSMTGGTEQAFTINQNLAKLAGKHGLGMGLGSCRSLLHSNDRLKDFSIKHLMNNQPLYANLGIAQLEECVTANNTAMVHEVVRKVEADGLIVHLNPLQEWFQPEGDRYKVSPLITLSKFLEDAPYPVIVKEVGHGLGPKSLAALLKLPLKAIEFGAYGGTNFSMLESLRGESESNKAPFINVGHTASEMVEILNALPKGEKEFIISGGITTVLDGYELLQKLKAPSVIGIAHGFLGPALQSFEVLEKYLMDLCEGHQMAKGLLTLREEV